MYILIQQHCLDDEISTNYLLRIATSSEYFRNENEFHNNMHVLLRVRTKFITGFHAKFKDRLI